MKETKIRPMTLVDYIDPGSGVPVKACSPDNGQTYKIYFTPWGIVWHADDVEVLWNDFLLDKVKSVMAIDWDSIKNKPKLVTQDELNERLAKLSVPTIDWSDIQNKPDLSQYVTKDELPAQPDLSGYAKTSDIPKSMTWNQITDKPTLALKSDIPSLTGYAKLTDIPSVSGLVKETELADYAKKSDLPTMPDLSGYATVSSLIDYAKKSVLANYYTKTETDTKLSTKADQAEYQTLNDKFNNMQIGGRNLLTGTRDWQGEWGNLSMWSVPVGEETYKGLTVRRFSSAWWALGQYYDAKPNTTYTFSFYAKTSEAGNFLEIFTLDKEDWSSPVVKVPVYANQAITTEWQRYSVTFTTKSGGTLFPSVCSNHDGITIYVAGYKLEEGTIPTDWTPAPEDFDTKLDAKADKSELVDYAKKSDIPASADFSGYATVSSLDKLKATLNSNIDASKVAYEQIYPTLINGTTGSVNAFLITLSEKVKMLAFWANVTLPTIQGWSQVDIMSFPEMHEQNHITLNQSVIPDNYHSLWADYSSTSFSLRNQTGATVSNYSFNFFSSGIFLY